MGYVFASAVHCAVVLASCATVTKTTPIDQRANTHRVMFLCSIILGRYRLPMVRSALRSLWVLVCCSFEATGGVDYHAGPTAFVPGSQYWAVDREGLGMGEERLDPP